MAIKRFKSFALLNGKIILRVGSNVLVKADDPAQKDFIGKILDILGRGKEAEEVEVMWYYGPEDTVKGPLEFHGSQEIFRSDHSGVIDIRTIQRKCRVFTLQEYRNLKTVDKDDLYCRFEYDPVNEAFVSVKVPTHCMCRQPENPDKPMLQCETCTEWFHLKCLDITVSEAKEMEKEGFICNNCSSRPLKKPRK